MLTNLQRVLIIMLVAFGASAQEPAVAPAAQASPSKRVDPGIAVAPARQVLVMAPGTQKTVVVNFVYDAEPDSPLFRAVVAVGDWNLNEQGSVNFRAPGTLPGSAAPWLIFSPTEAVATPGKPHPIRVTITVPPDAAAGDHLAALLIEPRPDNNKVQSNAREMVMRYRLASLFYIQVPALTREASLEGLEAEATPAGIRVTPTLRNRGNSHVRPVYSVQVLDKNGQEVGMLPEAEALPVLGGSTIRKPLVIEKQLPPGTYTAKYRVDFRNGAAVEEGVVEFEVRLR